MNSWGYSNVKKQQKSAIPFKSFVFTTLSILMVSTVSTLKESVKHRQFIDTVNICCLDQCSASPVICQDYSDPTNPHAFAAGQQPCGQKAEGSLPFLFRTPIQI